MLPLLLCWVVLSAAGLPSAAHLFVPGWSNNGTAALLAANLTTGGYETIAFKTYGDALPFSVRMTPCTTMAIDWNTLDGTANLTTVNVCTKMIAGTVTLAMGQAKSTPYFAASCFSGNAMYIPWGTQQGDMELRVYNISSGQTVTTIPYKLDFDALPDLSDASLAIDAHNQVAYTLMLTPKGHTSFVLIVHDLKAKRQIRDIPFRGDTSFEAGSIVWDPTGNQLLRQGYYSNNPSVTIIDTFSGNEKLLMTWPGTFYPPLLAPATFVAAPGFLFALGLNATGSPPEFPLVFDASTKSCHVTPLPVPHLQYQSGAANL